MPKVYLIKISPVKVFSSLILSCTLICFWSCSDSGEPKIEGCMDSTACNYSIESTHDDGSCWSPTEGCTCENAEAAVADCTGVCGGDAVATDCGCGLAASNATTGCCADGKGPADEEPDCAGTCGGIAIEDACGTCGGNITVAIECDCDDEEVMDCAGVCGGGAILSGCDNVCNSTKVNDCAGVCGGDSVNDECGVCGGGNSSCVNFSTEIQPIFTANCSGCHITSTRNNLSLSNYSSITSENSSNGPVIIAGDHTNSLLWQYVNSGAMPPSGQLTSDQVNLIATWIDEGALDN